MSSEEIAKKVCVYVDGFNLYHAIDDLNDNKLKWLNLNALSKSFLRQGENLQKVEYFTTVVTWNIQKRMRHEAYIKALKANGVVVTAGNFKQGDKHCSKNNVMCPFREEKQTDVAIGVTMVADAFEDVFDRAILITADTDQIPTIKLIQARFPNKKVSWIAPPGRMQMAREIGDLIIDRAELTRGALGTCKFPKIVLDANKNLVCNRPVEYA